MQISLRAARVNAGLTQKEAAQAVGVNISTIGSWERGRTSPKGVLLLALCDRYGVSVDAIFLHKKSSLNG